MLKGWHAGEIGAGKVTADGETIRLSVPPGPATAYHDAHIATYTTRRDITDRPPLRPPLRMTVRARAGGTIHGTAGFGFWNVPYQPGRGLRSLRPPRAVWFFFGSPPNDMPLALDVPGHGWKAATFDATRWPFFALLPAAPLGFLLMRIPPLYRRLWPIGQRAIGVSERLLDAALLDSDHTYTLDWRRDSVTFAVDGSIVHTTTQSPRGPLGFIAWVDNQYAVVSPKGRFSGGVLDVPAEQALLLGDVRVEAL